QHSNSLPYTTLFRSRLEEEFARYDAKPPARLTEVYESFLTDDAKLEVLLAERPAVVSFHFGLPDRDRIRALRAAGVLLLATATRSEEHTLNSSHVKI